jgi:hypothetical protein
MRPGAYFGTGGLLVVAALTGFVPAEHHKEPPTRDALLAVFEAREVLDLDWPRTLVTYRVDLKPGQARPGSVRLLDERGREQPCQLWRVVKHGDGSIASARVSFYAELKKNERYRYELHAGARGTDAAPLAADDRGPFITLDNKIVALRLPRVETHRVAPRARNGKPGGHVDRLRASISPGDDAVPGPIQGIRLADGRWVGGSYFHCADPERGPKVVGYRCEITEQGPLFVEARVRYEFGNGGFYQLTARLLAGDPAARIDEQSDLKHTDPGDACQLVVSLSGGWQDGGWKPDRVFWGALRGVPGHAAALEKNLKDLGFGPHPTQAGQPGSRAIPYDAAATKLFDLTDWVPWIDAAYYFGLVDSRTLTMAAVQQGQLPFLAVVPLHTGTWRGNQDGYKTLIAHRGDDVALHLPLLAPPHPNSLLHTGEYDPALPLSFSRRQWALVGGPFQYHSTLYPFRNYEGGVNLDNYKDWVLDWPEDPAIRYPRLALKRADVDRLAGRLDGHPGAAVLKQYLYFGDNPKRRQRMSDLTYDSSEWTNPRGQCQAFLLGRDRALFAWFSSYRQAQMAGWANGLDELLSSPRLKGGPRRDFRGFLAAMCCLLTEPDCNPRGSLIHLGNPNMPINRFFALTFAASLIPDHPRAREWLDTSAAYVRFKLAQNEAPGGAWDELLTYLMPGMHIVQAAQALNGTGRLDAATLRRAALPGRFALQLLAPRDPRFGARSLPNWGHEGCNIPTHWLVSAALVRDCDPELARALVWAWDQVGRPLADQHDADFSPRLVALADLLPSRETSSGAGYVPKELGSAWLPGFGAVLRAHAGDPDETYLSYRQGYLASHSDANQGDFVLFAKGAPLSTLSLFGYAIVADGPFAKLNRDFGWHNRVRFGRPTDTGGWPGGGPISQVHAHSFGDSVDYLRGLGDYGPQRWARQVVFLKGKSARGPNYFVFRDSFTPRTGADQLQEKWWYLRTPGGKEQVQASKDAIDYRSPYGARLNVRFLQPAAVAVETRSATHSGSFYGQAAHNWNRVHDPKTPKSVPLTANLVLGQGGAEETMSVSAAGPIAAGQDVLVALYPQAADEAAPRYEARADGAAKVTTSEGTDYVFVSNRPMQFAQGDVAFEGVAGAVRVYPNEVHLVIAEGPGRVAYQGTALVSPVPATRVIPRAELKSARTITVSAPRSAVTFALDPAQGAVEELAPGVRWQEQAHGFALEFHAAQPMTFDKDGATFHGRRGGIVVDARAGTARLVLLDGAKIGYGRAQVWGGAGPFDLTFHPDRVTGRTDGLGRFVYLSRPARLDRLPMLVIDGESYAPGTAEDTLIVPIMPGAHAVEVRALPQPPVYRTWQQW